MPLIVIDTNVALPATLSEPGGLSRKFLVVLALGALTLRAENLQLELDALREEQLQLGGELGGADSLDRVIHNAENQQAALMELLPYGTPSNWVMAASGYMLDEYERKAREIGKKFGRDIESGEAAALKRQLLALSVTAPDPLYVDAVPALTSDVEDDPIVFDALRVKADYLISDDKHIVPAASDGCHEHEFGENRILAMTFDHLMTNHLSDVEWDEIDGRFLNQALSRLGEDPQALDPMS